MPKSASNKNPRLPKKTSNAAQAVAVPERASLRSELPSVLTLVRSTTSTLYAQKWLFVRLIMLAWVITMLISGIVYATYYADLSQNTQEVTGNLPDGILKTAVEVAALTASLVSAGANGSMTEAQLLYMSISYLLLWLVLVWILRHVMNNEFVSLRDGLYSAAAPMISTILLLVILCLQLVPLALIVSILAAVVVNSVFTGIGWTLLFIIITLVAFAFTLYWAVTTLFALMIVTIPGTYPIAALRSARSIVKGYRRELLVRVVALLLIVILAQITILVPLIFIDALMGYTLSALVAAIYVLGIIVSYVYGGMYMYVLYRRLIDERS